jgi:hypothetical protein
MRPSLTTPTRTKSEMLNELRTMLRDVFAAKAAGESYARVARAHGYVDGYMRAIIECGVAAKEELLEVVSSAREATAGPAMRTLDPMDDADTFAA